MKLFNWFKKKVSLVSTPPTTNINGIYSARLEDLETIRNSLGSLQTQLQELSNRLDSLPPIPDHSQFARKDQENVFLAQQEIKTTAPYLSFKKQNNQRKGYIGTASSSSNDIELRAETNSLNMIANHNISLQAGSNYNITVNKDPTTNESVANKRYVDTKFASIPPVDLSNVAKLNAENTFTDQNLFNRGVIFKDNVIAQNIEIRDPGTSRQDAVNRITMMEYVDNEIKRQFQYIGAPLKSFHISSNQMSSTNINNSCRVIWIEYRTGAGDSITVNPNKKYRAVLVGVSTPTRNKIWLNNSVIYFQQGGIQQTIKILFYDGGGNDYRLDTNNSATMYIYEEN